MGRNADNAQRWENSWYERFVTLTHLILAFFVVFTFISILRYAQANFGVRMEYYRQISALSDPRKARLLDLGVFMQFINVIAPPFLHPSIVE
jgi:hypothetical protein